MSKLLLAKISWFQKSFLSKCWGGRATDKCITVNSGFFLTFILPDRDIPNRNLIVLCRFVIWICFCYSAWYEYGRSMNLSEQSIIQQALGYVSLKIKGKFAWQVSFDGHLIRKPRCWNITVIILWKESVAVVMDILKRCDKSSTRRPCLSLINMWSKPSDWQLFPTHQFWARRSKITYKEVKNLPRWQVSIELSDFVVLL